MKIIYHTLRKGTVKTIEVEPFSYPLQSDQHYKDAAGRIYFITFGMLYQVGWTRGGTRVRRQGLSARVE